MEVNWSVKAIAILLVVRWPDTRTSYPSGCQTEYASNGGDMQTSMHIFWGESEDWRINSEFRVEFNYDETSATPPCGRSWSVDSGIERHPFETVICLRLQHAWTRLYHLASLSVPLCVFSRPSIILSVRFSVFLSRLYLTSSFSRWKAALPQPPWTDRVEW